MGQKFMVKKLLKGLIYWMNGKKHLKSAKNAVQQKFRTTQKKNRGFMKSSFIIKRMRYNVFGMKKRIILRKRYTVNLGKDLVYRKHKGL